MKMKCRFLLVILLFSIGRAFSQQKPDLLAHGFAGFHKNWVIELQDSAASTVHALSDSLFVDTKAGATIWLKKILSGDIVIEYDRKVLLAGVQNKRLSDVNQFWMATDPGARYHTPFHFSGKFSDYDALSLYYFGFGGNTNKTTRFRKYLQGHRNLLAEYKDQDHLLHPDSTYHIKTAVIGNRILVWINNRLYFNYVDKTPLKSGYFGFRLTWSAQLISHFKVYRPDTDFIKNIPQTLL